MGVRDTNFYKNPFWIKTKNAYLGTINHLCERCFDQDKYVKADIVHHKIELTHENMDESAEI